MWIWRRSLAGLSAGAKEAAGKRATKAVMDAYFAGFAAAEGATLVAFDKALQKMAKRAGLVVNCCRIEGGAFGCPVVTRCSFVLSRPVDPTRARPSSEAALDLSQREALFLQAPDSLAAGDHVGGIELVAGGGDVGHFE